MEATSSERVYDPELFGLIEASMLIDPHVHTSRYSPCSVLRPKELVAAAKLFQLDGIVITEHNWAWEKWEIEELKQEAEAEDLVILRGQEVRTYTEGKLEGDILVFGFYEPLDREISCGELLELVHKQGGVAVAAHPFREGLGIGEAVYSQPLDGIEVLNSNNTPQDTLAALQAQAKTGLPGLGGSDAHRPGIVGHYLTYFEGWIDTEAKLIEEIRCGRCRPLSYRDAFND